MNRKVIALCVLALALGGKVMAQEAFNYDTLRVNTWSVYAQGGMTWAGGVQMENVNPVTGTALAPLVGGGVNYNIRPWVRLGLNYEFSKFKREQRFGELQALGGTQLNPSGLTLSEQNGGRAYTNRWTSYHAVDFTGEFNIMEIWNERQCKWFNLYAGVGIGGMFAHGNVYDIAMGYEHWEGEPGKNQHEMLAWLKAHNERHSFNALYLPVTLAAEFDVMPRLTLGVKAGYKFVISGNNFAPANVGAVAITARYNFVGKKQGYKSNKEKLDEAIAAYNALEAACSEPLAQCVAERNACLDERAQQAREIAGLNELTDRLKAENDSLRTLAETCERQHKALAAEGFFVMFPFSKADITDYQRERIVRYISSLPEGVKLEVIGEANDEGDSTYNQWLSEDRLEAVVAVLKELGINEDRIATTSAIGSSAKISDASARRVTIKVAE